MYCFTQGQVVLDSFFQLIKEIIIKKKGILFTLRLSLGKYFLMTL